MSAIKFVAILIALPNAAFGAALRSTSAIHPVPMGMEIPGYSVPIMVPQPPAPVGMYGHPEQKLHQTPVMSGRAALDQLEKLHATAKANTGVIKKLVSELEAMVKVTPYNKYHPAVPTLAQYPKTPTTSTTAPRPITAAPTPPVTPPPVMIKSPPAPVPPTVVIKKEKKIIIEKTVGLGHKHAEVAAAIGAAALSHVGIEGRLPEVAKVAVPPAATPAAVELPVEMPSKAEVVPYLENYPDTTTTSTTTTTPAPTIPEPTPPVTPPPVVSKPPPAPVPPTVVIKKEKKIVIEKTVGHGHKHEHASVGGVTHLGADISLAKINTAMTGEKAATEEIAPDVEEEQGEKAIVETPMEETADFPADLQEEKEAPVEVPFDEQATMRDGVGLESQEPSPLQDEGADETEKQLEVPNAEVDDPQAETMNEARAIPGTASGLDRDLTGAPAQDDNGEREIPNGAEAQPMSGPELGSNLDQTGEKSTGDDTAEKAGSPAAAGNPLLGAMRGLLHL